MTFAEGLSMVLVILGALIFLASFTNVEMITGMWVAGDIARDKQFVEAGQFKRRVYWILRIADRCVCGGIGDHDVCEMKCAVCCAEGGEWGRLGLSGARGITRINNRICGIGKEPDQGDRMRLCRGFAVCSARRAVVAELGKPGGLGIETAPIKRALGRLGKFPERIPK